MISKDQTLPNGKVLPALDHELVGTPACPPQPGSLWQASWNGPAPTARRGCHRDSALRRRLLPRQGAQRDDNRAIGHRHTRERNRRIHRREDDPGETGRAVIDAYDDGIQLTGNPVTDWQLARARLRGSNELNEVFGRARLLRLFHATDLTWLTILAWVAARRAGRFAFGR